MMLVAQNTSPITENAGENLLKILLPKLLDWPFLFFVGLLAICWWFRVELRSLLQRGDIKITWGDRSIHVKELSQSLDREFDPIRDDIDSLKKVIADTENSSNILPKELSDTDFENVKQKIRDALEKSKFDWRSIERLAAIAGVTEPQVLEILRADPEVRLSVGKSGRQIAGLKSRVGI